ncbi:hypothetical protein [Chloroflexus sp.]|nr:hypothetical protein [Chloroflexus sp.]
MARYRSRSIVAGNGSLLIACRCVILVTNNVREFSHVPGLPVDDWTQ